MNLLEIDLYNGSFELSPIAGKRGLDLAIDLYRSFPEGDAVIIAAPSDEASICVGSAAFTIVFRSPISEKMEFSYSNSPIGFSLYKLGIAAVVIRGRALKYSYISLYPGSFELLPADDLKGSDESLLKKAKNNNDAAIYSGIAADNGVRFAVLKSYERNLRGPGLGYVFAEHNIKGILVQGFSLKEESFTDKNYLKWKKRIEKSPFSRRVRRHGANCFLDDALRLGWLPVKGYSRRFDPRAYNLDGVAFAESYGNFPDSCQECFLACNRRKRDNESLPTWNETMMLGPNLGFFSPDKVLRLSDAARYYGLDINHLGSCLHYVSTLKTDARDLIGIRALSIENYERLIMLIGTCRGSGALFKDGLAGFPDAIQTDNHHSIAYDLRGAYSQAIAESMSLGLFLPAGLLKPRRKVNPECAAILALYEIIYSLALLSKGYLPLVSVSVYWYRLPELAFHVPAVMRLCCKAFSAFGHSYKDLIPLGLDILDRLNLELGTLPERFLMDPVSAVDGSTVPLLKLQDYFMSEKLKAEIISKSIKEKMAKESSDKSPAVGPAEERGLDGDPGLNK